MSKRRKVKGGIRQNTSQRPAAAAHPQPHIGAKGPAWVGAAAAVLGFLLYVNTFGHQYCLDDYSVIKENWVTQGGLKNIGLIFSTEYRYGAWNSPGSLYRPLALLIFALQWQLSPDNPMVGHVMNAAMYGWTGWLLWVTWRRILAAYSPALPALAVLLFMAHPVHTEVVANIKSLDEILALFFCTAALWSLWRYFDTARKGFVALSVLFYALALFSKESAITFLAIFPLTIWFFTDRTLRQNAQLSALFFGPAALFLFIRHLVLSAQPYPEVFSVLDNFIVGAKDASTRLASAFMMCGIYLKTLLFPHPLVSDRGYPQMTLVTFADARALAGFLAYAGVFLWALWHFRRRHILSYAILFYLIAFSLFSNIFIQIGTSYGERLLYAPSWGFALAVAALLTTLLRLKPEPERPPSQQVLNPNNKGAILWSIAGLIIGLYSFQTIRRNPVWYTSYTLYKADIPHSPNCAKLNYHMGIETIKEGLIEDTGQVTDSSWVRKAIGYHTRAIQLYPQYHDAYGSRGLAYFRLGQYDSAYNDYMNALRYRPNDDKVLSNLGFIYFLRQQLDSAETVYRRSIAANPRFIDARRNLGAVMAMQGRFAEAIEQWKEGLKYEPENPTLLHYIGSAYKDMGKPEEAQPWLERAEAARKAEEARKARRKTQ